MVDDYFLYLVELLHIDDRARELMHNITLDIAPEYFDTDYEGNKSTSYWNSNKYDQLTSFLLNVLGFLATVFANLDVTIPDITSVIHLNQHASPHNHATGNGSQYPGGLPEDSSCKFLIEFQLKFNKWW